MSDVNALMNVDFMRLIIDIFVVLIGVTTIFSIIGKFSETIGKPVRWVRQRVIDHELLQNTAQEVDDLEQKTDKISDIVAAMEQIQNNVKTLNDEIKNVCIAEREVLGSLIDQQFSKYVATGGIPEEEMEGFIALHDAYKGVGGNHIRDEKFNYVTKQLPIIPKDK